MKKYLILFTLIIYNLSYSQDNMYVMRNGAVVDQFNVNTQVDSVIFYNPDGVTGLLPDPIKTPTYPTLSEIIQQDITTRDIANWETVRRSELLNIFRDSVYGRSPQPATYTKSFTVASTTPIAGGVKKLINISITGPNGNYTWQAPLFIPNSTEKVPVFVLLTHRGIPSTTTSSTSTYFPLDNLIIPRGYAVAVINYADFAPDNASTYSSMLINKFNLNGTYDWKAISAWSFAASRMIDYLVTDPDIDASKIATVGHSRSGKASLWTGAQDQRVALTCVNNAGAAGDRLMLGSWQWGETIEQVNGFPHWFAPKFRDYNGMDKSLPFDWHMLIGLTAPRYFAQGLASGDDWADPVRQFHATIFAQPVFALYGKTERTWEISDTPSKSVRSVNRNGNIQSHMRIGGHDMNTEDWTNYLDFADLKL